MKKKIPTTDEQQEQELLSIDKKIEKDFSEPKVAKKRGRRPKGSFYYVSPKEFNEEICNYYKTDVITNKLGKMIYNIVEGLSYRPNFLNYTFKDQMIGDALIKIFKALKDKNYDLSRGNNPFSYFNRIAFHSFITRIQKEKERHQSMEIYKEQVYADVMNEFGCYVKSNQNSEEDGGNRSNYSRQDI